MLKPHQFIIRIAERLAVNFLGGVGRRLHEELVTRDGLNRDSSYMAGQPLLLHHNLPEHSELTSAKHGGPSHHQVAT